MRRASFIADFGSRIADFFTGQKSAAVQAFLRGDEYALNVAGAKLTQPYASSPWVQQGIRLIASQISAVPLHFAEDTRGGKKEFKDAELISFWERPARDGAGTIARSELIEATVGWLKLTGECFWLLGDEWIVNRFTGKREPFIIARPTRMKEVMQDGVLVGWRYTDGSGKTHDLIPEQVIYLRSWNPYDDVRGMGEYSAAKTAAESDHLAGRFALNLMRNNGDRGEYIIAKSGMPTDAQREQIVAGLRAKRSAAARGEFKPIFLTGDIAVESPALSAVDAAFVAQRLENRHEVAIALGIPPSMFDVVASYSVGSASDWFRLLHSACIPLANGKIADGIENVSLKFLTGRNAPLFASFCFDEHPTMQQVRKERLESADKLWAKGMPMEKINEYLQLGMPKFQGWEVGYLPFGIVEVGEETDPAKDEDYSETGEEKPDEQKTIADFGLRIADLGRLIEGHGPVERMMSALQMGARAIPDSGDRKPESEEIDQRDPKRLAQWRTLMAKQKATEQAFYSKITKALVGARAEVLGKLEKAKATKTVITRAAVADFLFDLAKFTKGIWADMRKVALTALETAGQQLLEEIGSDDPFTMPSPEALAYLAIRENRIRDASDEMYEKLKASLEEGLDAGESIEKLTDRVRSVFNGMSKHDAKRIAATETSSAYGVGRQRSMEKAGVTHKQWLTSGLDNIRASHLSTDEQIVPVDEPFDVDGEALMHPGDPTGSAANVINCRCVAIAVAAPDAEN